MKLIVLLFVAAISLALIFDATDRQIKQREEIIRLQEENKALAKDVLRLTNHLSMCVLHEVK